MIHNDPWWSHNVWSNYSDLTRVFTPFQVAEKGNPIISGKSRLVKYYSIWPDPWWSHNVHPYQWPQAMTASKRLFRNCRDFNGLYGVKLGALRDDLSKLSNVTCCQRDRCPPFNRWLGGGNSNISLFSPRKLGKMIHFDSYFSDGLKPPTRWSLATRNEEIIPWEWWRERGILIDKIYLIKL